MSNVASLTDKKSCEINPQSTLSTQTSAESGTKKEKDEACQSVGQSGEISCDGTNSDKTTAQSKENEVMDESDWLQRLDDDAKAALTIIVANGDHNSFVEYLQRYLGWIPSSPELHLIWDVITSQVNKQSSFQFLHPITTTNEDKNENGCNNETPTKTQQNEERAELSMTNKKWSDVKILWKWTQARSWPWPSSWSSWAWSSWSWSKFIPQGLDRHINAPNVTTSVNNEEMGTTTKSSYEKKWYQRISSRWRLGEKSILVTQQMPSNKTLIESWLSNSQVVTEKAIAHEKSQTYVTHLKPPANETLLFVFQNNRSHTWDTQH